MQLLGSSPSQHLPLHDIHSYPVVTPTRRQLPAAHYAAYCSSLPHRNSRAVRTGFQARTPWLFCFIALRLHAPAVTMWWLCWAASHRPCRSLISSQTRALPHGSVSSHPTLTAIRSRVVSPLRGLVGIYEKANVYQFGINIAKCRVCYLRMVTSSSVIEPHGPH